MAESLYRKWRSRGFFEVVGQDHVTQTLRNAVRTNSVGHAYLFTGPRGTGKTSSARILARAVNCLNPHDGEPCNECAPCQAMLENRCLDVTEIDAASNNSVDDIRDLRDKVNFAPGEVRRKVYIIDEVHMLSTPAFNALLKTLEEPPAHVLFALATTDAQKVPATITSRCQRLDFRIISPRDITARLAYVCEQEGMLVDEAALELLAQHATGSLRDALSLLDQVRAYEGAAIGVRQVEDALGLARRETLLDLTAALTSGDVGTALVLLNDLAVAGTDMRQYARQLVQYWRDLLLLCAGGTNALGYTPDERMAAQAAALTVAEATTMLKALLQPDYSGRRSASAQWQLELAVVEASQPFMSEDRPAMSRPPAPSIPRSSTPVREAASTAPLEAPVHPAHTDQTQIAASSELPASGDDMASAGTHGHGAAPDPPQRAEAAQPPALGNQSAAEIWAQALQALSRDGNAPVVGKLKSCVPVALEGDTFVVQIKTVFERERVEAPKPRAAIEAALRAVLGRAISLRCVTIGATPAAPTGNGPGVSAAPPETFKSVVERDLRAVHMERKTF